MNDTEITPEYRRAIHDLPKVELHLHLDGTLEPAMRIDLARRNGVSMAESTPEEIYASYTFTDLPSFIASYNAAQDVMITARDFEDVAYAYLSRAAVQNVRHVEMFFDPQLHTSRGVDFADIVGGYRRAIVRAARELGVTAELILCFLRDFSAEHAMTTLTQALPYRGWIIGVGLDSVEEGNPPQKFASVFERARTLGFLLTFHSDLEQHNQGEHLRQGLHELGVDRIDHGLHLLEDPELLQEVISRNIGVTATPLGYGTFTETMKLPEVRALLDAGAKISVGSDDPAFFGGGMEESLLACAVRGSFTLAELIRLQENAIETAWISSRRRDELRTELAEFTANR